MTLLEAKEAVVLAGRKLVESGLIARTWGNVSCRISSSQFVITPSGRDYLSLTPKDIVEVSISDCSYTGNVKPSSEKGVHAEVYKLYPDINFVIHTHQEYASAVSVLGLNTIKVSNEYPTLCGEVICADYGLPSTKTLRRNVAKALTLSRGNAVIMKNHGALCFGESYQQTFQVAQELENACENFLRELKLDQLKSRDMDPFKTGCFALSKLTSKTFSSDIILSSSESERTANGFRLIKEGQTYDIITDKFSNIPPTDLLTEIQLHNKIYKSHPNINNMIYTTTPAILAVSCAGINMYPLLDDFAQIAGACVKTVTMDADQISSALKKSPAVLLENNGAICCGYTKGDAQAVSIVTEKNSNALIYAALSGKVKYIKHIECMIMSFVYRMKYSKEAYKK